MAKYCLPIVEEEFSSLINLVEQKSTKFDLFEVWVDYITDLTPDCLSKLCEDLPDKLIFIFRRLNGETAHLSKKNRQDLIRQLSTKNVYLDFDGRVDCEDLHWFKSLSSVSAKLITSFHDYLKTPPTEELAKIVQEFEVYDPEIIKIATFCNQESDAIRILELLLLLRDRGCVVLGMGPQGAVTRVFGHLWGNRINYAPEILEKGTASGQITYDNLQLMISCLRS